MRSVENAVFPGGYSPAETKGECWFDEKAADLAIRLSQRYFVHVKGPLGGQPLVPAPWQEDFYGTVFGWKRQDGRRRYRIAYCEIPRGNGKSTMCVVVAGDLLFVDDEPGADVFSVAGTRDQSKEVFGPFKENCMRHPTLKSRTRCYVNSIAHIDPKTGIPRGVYKAISADAAHQHGGSPHGVIFDELHVQPNRELWDVMWTGAVKRRNPLTVAITTAGFDRNSICYEQRLYAEKVRDGIIHDESFLPVIYAADPDDDWKDPATWRKANPNLGVSILEEDIAKECQRAIDIPGYENTFKRLHLNIWTEQETRWLSMDSWDACDAEFDLDELKGLDCYAGLDLASTTDIAALVLAFHHDGRLKLVPHFFVPKENIRKRSLRDRVPYEQWDSEGLLIATPGNVTDYDFIRAKINELQAVYEIKEIAIDRWNATHLSTHLMADGFEVVMHGQGFADMTAPSKELERLVLSRELMHGGNAVLRWMASNVTAEQDAAGNLKPSKKKSTERIDGIVASVMAIGRAMLHQDEGAQLFL